MSSDQARPLNFEALASDFNSKLEKNTANLSITISIRNSKFSVSRISIFIKSITSFNVFNSTFKPLILNKNNSERKTNDIIILDSCYIFIDICTYEGFFSDKGSVLKVIELPHIPKGSSLNLSISRSVLKGNHAELGGCIYIYGWVEPSFFANTFENHKAVQGKIPLYTGIGVVLYFTCGYCTKIYFFLDGNNFYNNFAEFYAPTYFSCAKLYEGEKKNVFLSNQDAINFTSQLSSLPLKSLISDWKYYLNQNHSNSNISIIKNSSITVVSGIDFSFTLTLTDHQGNK